MWAWSCFTLIDNLKIKQIAKLSNPGNKEQDEGFFLQKSGGFNRGYFHFNIALHFSSRNANFWKRYDFLNFATIYCIMTEKENLGPWKTSPALLNWKFVQEKVPWGTMFLLGIGNLPTFKE